jgi:mannose-6-phosphate isomerase-like protein (cupin superfamily)
MPVLSPAPAISPFPGATFHPLVAPSRGAERTSVWQATIEPGPLPDPHQLTAEEVFVVLDGTATVRLAGETLTAGPGDAIVVPPDTDFALHNTGAGPLRLLCALPVGGQVRMPDGAVFTPPWTA